MIQHRDEGHWAERAAELARRTELHRQAHEDALEARDSAIREADAEGYGVSKIARWFRVSQTRVFQVIGKGAPQVTAR